jgi:hypothetical protein
VPWVRWSRQAGFMPLLLVDSWLRNSTGVSMPSAEWRRWRLWKIAGSACVIHLPAARSVRPRMSDLGVEVRSWLRAGRRDGLRSVRRSPGRLHRRVRRQPARMSPAPRAPTTTGHRCATSSLRRARRDRPCPDHRRRSQRILGWCWAFVWPGLLEGDACGSLRTRAAAPGRTGFLDGIGGQLEQKPHRGRCCSSGAAARAAPLHPTSMSSAIPDSYTWIALARSSAVASFGFAITMTVPGLDDTQPGT